MIISQFADTVNYYYKNLHRYFNTPKITLPMGKVLGNDKENYINRIPAKSKEEVLDAFSPISKRQQQIIDDDRQIDLVVGTDTISTGQNLQDAVTLINLDLPYNPMILEQRIGRIDRPRHDAARVKLYIYTCPVYQSIDSQLKMTKRLGSKMQGVLEDTQFDNVVLPEYTNYLKATAEHKQNAVANMLDQTEDAITYQNGMQSEKHSEQYRLANKRMYDFKTNGDFKQGKYFLPDYSFARNDLDSIAVIQLHLKDVNDSALRDENIIVNLTKQKEGTVVSAEKAIHDSIKDDVISTKKLSQGKAELEVLNTKKAVKTVIGQVIDQYNSDQAVTATNEKDLSSKKGRIAASKIHESVQNPKNRTMILSKLKLIDMEHKAVASFAKYLETVSKDDPAYPLVEIIADNVDYFWTHIAEYKEYLTPDSIAAAQHIGKERRQINTRKASLDNSNYDLLLSNLIVKD
ncbi:C-terminal helicase domain-containing protein [Lactobacillus kefiranofaciens]|uniref:C-terminal helicase domain-containing protein n=2 Tax=Lactobacillus kefiranofaciens TaxID=267818 RepID=A0AAX3UHU5_9LACO|nr:C-terminal helicase domain-containing protein [Lactobacillus kefiranofaciens]QFQ68434.1 SWF/SNF helicase family protein [Lactobacillus kefiranofaciens subsp. kefiranofaciens]WGO86979.1 C-terminal helicase domain-containing protein [Lactobacillus kefiranofaciens]WQH37068.1 C-terminal helicase domain-containing protein [Lactobacillus kefiranofaciens]